MPFRQGIARRATANGIQITCVLTTKTKQVGDKHCFKNALDKHNSLKLSAGDAPKGVLVHPFAIACMAAELANVMLANRAL